MKKRRPVLVVNQGDIVEINLEHKDLRFNAEVVDVIKRYGANNNVREPKNALLKVHDTETLEEMQLDNAYVSRVVARYSGPVQHKKNIFLGQYPPEKWGVHTVRRGKYAGYIPELIALCLAKSRDEIARPLDREKCLYLFNKDLPGYIDREGEGSAFVIVNCKPFRNWVQRNATKFLKTTRRLHVEQTQANQHWENEYWKYVEIEALRDFEVSDDMLEDEYDFDPKWG